MNSIPYGYCHCGCGRRTKLARCNYEERGWVKGEPLRYINGHYWKGKKHPESLRKILSEKAYKRFKNRENHPAYKDGTIKCRGYLYVYVGNNPNADNKGYIKRCVLKAQQALRRPLKKWDEMVHHIDGNRMNDDNNNLLVCTRGYHNLLHARMKNAKSI